MFFRHDKKEVNQFSTHNGPPSKAPILSLSPFLLSPAPAPMLSTKAEMGASRGGGQESRGTKDEY